MNMNPASTVTIQDPAPKKLNKTGFIFMSLIALLMGYAVIKETQLPPLFLALGAAGGGTVLLLAGLKKPHVITYVLVAYLPFSKILAGDFGGMAMGFNMTNMLMIFIMLAWFSGSFTGDKEPPWISTPLNLPVTLFMLAGLFAVFRGSNYMDNFLLYAMTEFKRWITPVFLFFLVLNTVKQKETVQTIVYVMIAVTTIVGLMAIFEYFDIGQVSHLDKARVGGISDHSNSLAAFFNYYMFLPLGFFLMNMNRLPYWLLLIPFLIQFRGIMVTFSRGGYLGFATGFYAITFFKSKMLFIMLLIATAAAVLNPVLLPPGIRYRMGQTLERNVAYVEVDEIEGSLESSAQTRVQVWKGAIEMIKDHPVFGTGYGTFQNQIQYYWEQHRPIDAHNTYLIIAAEMGIPTLLIFLLIVFMVFFQTYRLYLRTEDNFTKSLSLGLLGGLFGLLMSNMFGSRLDSQEISSYFWILAALVMRLHILEDRAQKNTQPQKLISNRTRGPVHA